MIVLQHTHTLTHTHTPSHTCTHDSQQLSNIYQFRRCQFQLIVLSSVFSVALRLFLIFSTFPFQFLTINRIDRVIRTLRPTNSVIIMDSTAQR